MEAKKQCQTGGHPCTCQTQARRIALIAPDILERFPDLGYWVQKCGWPIHVDGIVIEVALGPGTYWSGLAEFVGFLRTIVREDQLVGLKAAWLTGHAPINDQFATLFDSQPILEMVTTDSTPLAGMLTRRQVETWFQPIVRAKTYDIWGYECLARGWLDSGDIVSPLQLLQWAEQEDLTFMFDRVCRETHLINAGRANVDRHRQFLINFLPTAIYDPEYCLRTSMEAARRADLDPARVIFEVVETCEVEDRTHLRRILDYYRSRGFRVALDDVSAGYSGLSMLADLEPDLIKIDRELAVRAAESEPHLDICVALVELAHKKGKLILAEGVETEAQLQTLEPIGVDLFQGFLFAKPAPEAITAVSAPSA